MGRIVKVSVRSAEPVDSGFFYAVRTTAEYQKWCHDRTEIKIECHTKWYAKKLRDPDTLFTVGMVGEKRIGYVRFEPTADTSVKKISFALECNELGKGYSVPMIKQSINLLACCQRSETCMILATTLEHNVKSQKALYKSGFSPINREKYEFLCQEISENQGSHVMLFELGLSLQG